MEDSEKDILAPLQPIENLIIVTKGGAQPILLDKYFEYLNFPLKIVKMSDLVNYLDIFEKYHFQFPNEKNVLNSYLKMDQIILGFNDYLADFGNSENENYYINSSTGKVKITLAEYLKNFFIMNPQYTILPFEYIPSDAGKKRVLRFLNKLNIVFENLEKNPSYKDCKSKFIIPYYLDHTTFLEENQKYKSQINKSNGLLIFNDINKNIKYEKIVKYKDLVHIIKKGMKEEKEKNKDKENPMIIKSSTDNIIDLIIGALIGCTHYEINFPHIYAQDGKCLNINFNDYIIGNNYGKINELENFDFEPNLLDMNDIKYSNETVSITEGCQCFSCLTGYKRSYLCHLFKCKELNGPIIISIHNYFQVREMYKKLNEFKDEETKLNNFVMWFLTTQCYHKK